jgi:hypothetical protein
MPRPYPPPPVTDPPVRPFSLGDAEERDLARVLGLERLSPEVSCMIAGAIAAYIATETGAADTTIANTLAALAELTRPDGRGYRKFVERIADDRSGVDYTTHGVLQQLAKAELAGKPGASEALVRAACERAAVLREHKRVSPPTESMRFFCGVLREIFRRAARPTLASSGGDAWHHCRRFALEVFTIAGIEHADFDAHPERLTEYLGTNVTG